MSSYKEFAGIAGLAVASIATAYGMRRVMCKGQEEDWRRPISTAETFHRKLQGLLTHAVSARPSRPEWETKLYTDPSLKMHPRLSRLATSASSDGLILKDLPRVYAPFTKFTDEDMVAPDHAQRLEKRTVFCVWHFGDDGVGHPETVHGGCIAMAFDESFGHAFMSLDRGTGFTAFLNINYRKPLPTGNAVLITVEMEKLEGRKVFMKASMTDGVDMHFSDATCLFVHPKKEDPVEVAHARTESS